MADSPSRIRTPWLRHESDGCSVPSLASAAGLEEGLPTAADGGGLETRRPGDGAGVDALRGTMRRLLCKAVVALGVVAALCLCVHAKVGDPSEEPEFTLLFEGEVPQGSKDANFSLHAGSVCFGISDQGAMAGHLRLEIEADLDMEAAMPRSPDTDHTMETLEEADSGLLLSGAFLLDHRRIPESRIDPRGLAYVQLPDSWEFSAAGSFPYGDIFGGIVPGAIPKRDDNTTSAKIVETGSFAAWGEIVHGRGVYKAGGLYVQVEGFGYLPEYLDGVRVLVPEKVYVLTSSAYGVHLKHSDSFREPDSKDWVPNGSVVSGFVVHGNSLSHVRKYEFGQFPTELNGDLSLKDLQEAMQFELLGRKLPPWLKGHLTWMFFDDQDVHWGVLQNKFETSELWEQEKAASQMSRFAPLPWPKQKSMSIDFSIREGYARHWHIVLNGDNLMQGAPRSRYRVYASGGLKTFGPGSYFPGKCPAQPPLKWLQRHFNQGMAFLGG